jgi:predicted metal-dependent phosphoesterase TrpH
MLLTSKALRRRKFIRENEFLREDWHNHTWRSDGELGVLDLVLFHKLLGFKKLAITDHDFLLREKDSRTARLIRISCRLLGIAVDYGVEFTCRLDISFLKLKKKKKIGVHIVGLGFDPDDQDILEALVTLAKSRMGRSLDLLQEIGISHPDLVMPAALEKTEGVMSSADVARQVCALNPQLDYSALLRSLLTHRKYHVSYEKAEAEEVVAAIKRSGGIAILAHPVKALKENFCHLDEIVGYLVPLGLDGIEVFARGQKPPQMIAILEVCKKYHLRIYAGADTHGLKNLLDYVEEMNEYCQDPDVLALLQKFREWQQA